MKFKDILLTVGTGLLSSNPYGAAIVGAVNLFLDDDDKLPEGATGEQLKQKIEKLSPEAQASLFEKEIALEIAREEGWTERYKAMCSSDGQSTRPKIALMMAKIFSACLLGFLVIIAYAVAKDGMEVLNQPYLWTVFATLTATPAGVLMKYFGELRREQSNRLNSLGNKGIVEDLGLFEKLFNNIKGKK